MNERARRARAVIRRRRTNRDDGPSFFRPLTGYQMVLMAKYVTGTEEQPPGARATAPAAVQDWLWWPDVKGMVDIIRAVSDQREWPGAHTPGHQEGNSL